MPTTHTLVIGAGQAGLAMSRMPHRRRHRPRRARARPRRRALAERTLGVAPTAHPQLGQPAPRLDLPGPRPRRLHDRRRGRGLPHGLCRLVRRAGPGRHTTSTPFAEPTTASPCTPRQRAGSARNVVIATGWCDQPRVPGFAAHLDPAVAQITAEHLPQPRAAARRAGARRRRVRHRRAARRRARPSRPRGRAGRRPPQPDPPPLPGHGHLVVARPDRHLRQDHRRGQRPRPGPPRGRHAARRPRPDHRDVDLPALQGLGVRLAGRLGRHRRRPPGLRRRPPGQHRRLPTSASTGSSPRSTTTSSPTASTPRCSPPALLRPLDRGPTPLTQLDLAATSGIAAVVWATGYRRPYPWLHVPVLDHHGEITQRRGVTPVAGLYVLGQRFQHRRDSNFIDGVRHDAAYLAHHIASRLAPPRARAPPEPTRTPP